MRIFWLAAAFLSVFVFSPAAALAGQGHVYLFKGLANVFSGGMDSYAAELASYGVPVTVANHTEAQTFAAEAARLSRSGKGPIFIVGHSLGGDAAYELAEAMKPLGGRVALVVSLGAMQIHAVPSNVDRVVNYYGSAGGPARVAPGSHAAISNIDITPSTTINHFNIDKVPSVQQKAVGQILAILHGGRHRIAAPKTAAVPSASTTR